MLGPIIILAPMRSFTSVINAMIGQHPQLYGLPELNLFIAEFMDERQELASQPKTQEDGLLRAVAQLYSGEQNASTILLARRWLERRSQCTCVSVFRELMEKASPRILVDKSISTVTYVEYMQRIRRSFPDARFIHLLRHPRPMCESVQEMGGEKVAEVLGALDYRSDPPIPDYQKIWFTIHMNIVTFLDGLPKDQWIRVRGEDVLANPKEELTHIADWLQVSTADEAIGAMLHPERSPFARPGPVNARFGNDPKFQQSPELRTSSRKKTQSLKGPLRWREDGAGFSPELVKLAQEFGYK